MNRVKEKGIIEIFHDIGIEEEDIATVASVFKPLRTPCSEPVSFCQL